MVRNKLPSKIDGSKKFEKNNLAIALDIRYAKMRKYSAYLSKKKKLTLLKQAILLMIRNVKGWYYIEVKNNLYY